MKKTAIVTDSNSGITPAEAEELGIYLVPMPFFIDGELFYEGVNLSHEDFYSKMAAGADISTSQPTPGAVLDLWDTFYLICQRRRHVRPETQIFNGSVT